MSEDIETKRIIYSNGNEVNKIKRFPTNYVSTTKYNVITFVPKCLFEQFKKVANIYFLVAAVLQSIPIISPLSPISAIAPLGFVLCVAMLREGLEDYFRYKSDKETNSIPVNIYIDGSFVQMRCAQIQVGQIVMVKKDEPIPCDLIMLANSNENSVAFIETSTLDGEKALKPRQSFPKTKNLINDKDFIRFFNVIECDPPNPRIYHFNGTISYGKKKKPVDKNHLLLGGAFLRNTSWAIGVVVYTGRETKLRQNLMSRAFKQSRIDKKVNLYICYILFLQFFFCITCAICSGIWVDEKMNEHRYLHGRDYPSILEGTFSYFTYFLLLNTMIPISLIVSLEFLKVAQGFFMERDVEMYSSLRDRTCKVSSYSLNEELGMIQHIFSDKTGTLTQNRMEFKFCSVGNKMYGEFRSLADKEFSVTSTYSTREIRFSFNTKDIVNDSFSHKGNEKLEFPLPIKFNEKMITFQTQREVLDHFLRCLALCHECLIETNEGGEINYIGQSPDEIALVDAVRHVGFRCGKIKDDSIQLDILPFGLDQQEIREYYEKYCILEFDSNRKRNSVIVRDLKTNLIFLFTKGADNIIKNRLDPSNSQEYIAKINQDLETFAKRGYRTLLFAFKIIKEQDFLIWKEKYDEACTAIENRNQKIADIAEEIETDLFLLGCTAVEDALQEEVPQTINALLEAGIKIWMLTGDKLETAENIGRTCELFDDNMLVERCPGFKLEACCEILKNILEIFNSADQNSKALIIEGHALEYVLYNPNDPHSVRKYPEITESSERAEIAKNIKKLFLKIAEKCKTVICCRVTPGQKQEIVKLMKHETGVTTLAIGDGANDVSMILEAHVGIGIYGEEGMQAVQASDYAIGEFKYLWELLLVHGRFNYIRESEMIMYFFYKNLVFTIPQFFFAFYCAYSGQTVYDDWYISLYNTIFTALPLMVKALFEKDIVVPQRTESQASGGDLLAIRKYLPLLYCDGRCNRVFTNKNFLWWMFLGFFHSSIIFFIPLLAIQEGIMNYKGDNYDIWSFSVISFSCVVFVVNLKLLLTTRLWNKFHSAAMLGTSIFLYVLFMLIYDNLTPLQARDTVLEVLTSPVLYFSIILTASYIFIFDGSSHILRRLLKPTDSEVLLDYSTAIKQEKVHNTLTYKKLPPSTPSFSSSSST
ncbi:unnamed protein product [Blepharisma stoltei]|uniref:Phospholipid-transporting ATPase n=1 Tax=Blepharisma stoltei TaxID=1481888 RepID=A0AAU9IM97_9CILI|nr:unnamed protein product [Blepharisma stoltei]